MYSINCVGKDGVERTFVFEAPKKEQTYEGHWEFFVVVKTCIDAIYFFELRLRQTPEDEFQIIAISHDNYADYVSKGIPDALLPRLSEILGGPIRSSRSDIEGTNEFRTPAASKMWDRLVNKELARYYAEEDVYRTL